MRWASRYSGGKEKLKRILSCPFARQAAKLEQRRHSGYIACCQFWDGDPTQPIRCWTMGSCVIDYMGDDAICQAARVSYSGTKSVQNDEGLSYLMRHWHSTPFEMCEINCT